MKFLWSTLVGMLLSFLASMCIVYAGFAPKPVYVKAGIGALGLCFAVAFIHYSLPEKRFTAALVNVLHACTAALAVTALVSWLLAS